MANNSLKEIVKKVLERLTNTRLDTLLNVASGLSTTTYTLSNSLADYDFIIVSAYSGYNNRWQMTIPVGEFISSAGQNYHTALGTEYAVYNLSISYISNTQIGVSGKGTGTIGINIAGVKFWGGVLRKCSKIKAFSDFVSLLFGGDVDERESERTGQEGARKTCVTASSGECFSNCYKDTWFVRTNHSTNSKRIHICFLDTLRNKWMGNTHLHRRSDFNHSYCMGGFRYLHKRYGNSSRVRIICKGITPERGCAA